MSTETDSSKPDWYSDPLTVEEIQQCADAGASEAFLAVLRTDAPEGVDRHSVRIEVKKQLRSWDMDPEDMTRRAGHFFTALYNDDARAYRGYADSNNQQILDAAGV